MRDGLRLNEQLRIKSHCSECKIVHHGIFSNLSKLILFYVFFDKSNNDGKVYIFSDNVIQSTNSEHVFAFCFC